MNKAEYRQRDRGVHETRLLHACETVLQSRSEHVYFKKCQFGTVRVISVFV